MLKFFVVSILLLFSHNALSQGGIWLLGYQSWAGPPFGGMKMDFSSGSMVLSYEARDMHISMTSATITDTASTILFYSNGVYIANALDDTMFNGSGLSPSYYTSVNQDGLFIPQAVLILPQPGNSELYCVFHNTVDDSVAYSHRLYYSIVDMTLDNSLGAVVSKNNILMNDTLLNGHLTAVKHGNGRDWWIVHHGGKNDKHFFYLLSPAGIQFSHSQQIGNVLFAAQGQVAFSPDGSKFALYDPLNDLQLLDFDRCSGLFSNYIHVGIQDSAGGGGVAFSPNSKVLYVPSTNYLYQFDLTVPDIQLSQTTVAVWDTFFSPNPPFATNFYLAMLAPDNRIYISSNNGVQSMHFIEFPDSLGLACNVCQHCLSLPAFNGTTIPNHPNYHLSSLANSTCDTLTSNISPQLSKEQIFVYPNPVRDKLYLRMPVYKREYSIKIINSFGVDVIGNTSMTKENGNFIMNMEGLSSGLYFLEVLSNEFRKIERIIKE